GKLMRLLDRPVSAHERLPKTNFNRSDQNGFGAPCRVAHGVETEMDPVNKIDVSMTRRSIKGAIPRRFADEAMAGRIADDVSLRFDDRSTRGTGRRVAHHQMPQKP